MKISTSELAGPALDWAVAKCEGFSYEAYESNRKKWAAGTYRPQHWMPSTDWSQGGPIVVREGVSLNFMQFDNPPYWTAHIRHEKVRFGACAPTPLIAAMRCYITSKLGDEVDVPEELL